MVGFFEKFPSITHNDRLQKNITARVDFFNKIKDNISLFEQYDVKDGQKPEDVAYQLYGDPELYWILFYLNDIVDPFYDWVLTEKQLNDYIISEYGAENVYAIHHYETIEEHPLGAGIITDQGEPFNQSVTNYKYEFDLNEEKRRIKILKRRYLDQVITEYSNQF